MGKVPAVLRGEALITELVAITIYLADLFPEAGITPTLHDALREPGGIGMMPYGDYDGTIKAVVTQLSKGPWLLGERFTAADVLWGTALTWVTGFGMVEAVPPVKAYIDRWNARPSVKKVADIDAGLLKAQAAP